MEAGRWGEELQGDTGRRYHLPEGEVIPTHRPAAATTSHPWSRAYFEAKAQQCDVTRNINDYFRQGFTFG